MSVKELLLVSPIKKEDGSIIDKITLREPTAGELDFAENRSKTTNGRTIAIIAQVSSLNEAVVRQLGARDYVAANTYISTFLEDTPPTTES